MSHFWIIMNKITGKYSTQVNLEDNVCQVMVKRVVDKNDVLRYFEDSKETKKSQKRTNLMLRAQICVDESDFNLKKESSVFDSCVP